MKKKPNITHMSKSRETFPTYTHATPYSMERVDAQIVHPPANWMKIMAVDPGTHRSGLLCAAVPPPPPNIPLEKYRPTRLHVYAEAMLYNAHAGRMAEVAAQLTGGWLFELIIIDKKGSDPKPGGFQTTIREQYESEFRRAGIFTRQCGDQFVPGTPDVVGREMRLRDLMIPRDLGGGKKEPILRITANCTNLIKQMKDFYRSKTDLTKREDKKHKPLEVTHCLEYIAGYFDGNIYYYPPQPAPPPEDTSQRKVEKLLALCQKTGWQPFSRSQKRPARLSDYFPG